VKIARWAAVPAALTIALGAAACGSKHNTAAAPPSPSTLSKQVKSAVQHAQSVHITGVVKQGGKVIALNLSMTRAGGLFGRVSVNGAGFGVLSTGGSTYLKVNSGFLKYLRLPSTACTLMCGKYLKATPAQSASLVGNFRMSSLLASMNSNGPNFHYGGSQNVDGQNAWVLHVKDGSTAFVAARGTHYPLRVVAPASHHAHLDFTQWNSVTIPPAPPANKVVDLSKLHG
jgi:hypothetical protein